MISSDVHAWSTQTLNLHTNTVYILKTPQNVILLNSVKIKSWSKLKPLTEMNESTSVRKNYKKKMIFNSKLILTKPEILTDCPPFFCLMANQPSSSDSSSLLLINSALACQILFMPHLVPRDYWPEF